MINNLKYKQFKKDARCKMQDARRGFSLVELIMYLAIIGSLVGVVVGMFVSFNRLRVKSESQTELSQNARSAVERLRQEIVKAVSVDSPSAGSSANALNLVMASSWTCFRINANILEMSEGGSGACSGSWNPITSSKVGITNSDIFTRIDNNGAKSTIQIKLTLTYNNRTEYTYTTQTTAGLR
ncbi:prepilin-type N-terminal cleavage/methylation domain-containing protein [Patescibacteria group bacterium]|nr:MAG: prepilin-type N-terminal cleavage/methylation domain-containing protein [Patescibacteria group bacterium]